MNKHKFMGLLIFRVGLFILTSNVGKVVGALKHCTEIPVLVVKTKDIIGNLIINERMQNSSDSVVIPDDPVHVVEIYCTSCEPIEVDFVGEMLHSFEDVIYSRTVNGDYKNSASFCFRVLLAFNASKTATGNYICTVIDNPSLQSSVYVYINKVNSTGYLLNSDSSGIVKEAIPDGQVLIIPCVITNPYSAAPKLFIKSTTTEMDKTTSHTTECSNFFYDSRRGFFIDTRDISDWATNFTCELVDEQKLEIKITKPKDFRVYPPHTSLPVRREYGFLNLTCESVHPVHLKHRMFEKVNINCRENGRNDSHYYYRYAAILICNGTFSENFNVSCVGTEELTHEWKIFLIDSSQSGPGLKFVEDKKSFFCLSTIEENPEISLSNCGNPMNCKIEQRYYKQTSKINKNDRGYNCREKPTQIYKGCAEYPIQKGEKLGMAHCGTQFEDYFLIYYTSLTGETVTTLDRNNVGTVFRMSRIIRTLYVNETVSFYCEASVFPFAAGIYIVFQFKNGSEIQQTEFERIEFNEKQNRYRTEIYLNITIWTADIKAIVCFAPVWNTKHWIKISQNLTVEDGEFPYIIKSTDDLELSQENTESFRKNNSLMCEAAGIPRPAITWEKDGFALPQVYNSSCTALSKTAQRCTLPLPKLDISEPLGGNYVCIAINAKGSTRKTFTIIVKESHMVLYLIVAGLLTLIVAIVLILLRTLRKQKKTIEQLTDAEIDEFEYGNEALVRKNSELNEIAQYLPYNLEYEIPENKLDIINEDLLGTGAFGIVLKGFLEKSGEKFSVAIKTTKSTASVQELKKLLTEIKIMMYIGRHMNIIHFIGAQTRKLRDGKITVIVEYCRLGNLQSYLRDNRTYFLDQILDDNINENIMKPRNRNVTFARTIMDTSAMIQGFKPRSSDMPYVKTLDLVKWCFQLASGMEYLGQKKVIHGDLATRNLLLSDDLTLKITDFGLSRHMYEYTDYIKKKKDEPLPWRWLSIEAIRDSKFSTQSDVWAYGVTLWEIFTLAEVPYPGFSWGEEFVKELYKGYRMGKPQYSTTDLYNTMLQCWSYEVNNRPTFADLKEYFRQTLEYHSGYYDGHSEWSAALQDIKFDNNSVLMMNAD